TKWVWETILDLMLDICLVTREENLNILEDERLKWFCWRHFPYPHNLLIIFRKRLKVLCFLITLLILLWLVIPRSHNVFVELQVRKAIAGHVFLPFLPPERLRGCLPRDFESLREDSKKGFLKHPHTKAYLYDNYNAENHTAELPPILLHVDIDTLEERWRSPEIQNLPEFELDAEYHWDEIVEKQGYSLTDHWGGCSCCSSYSSSSEEDVITTTRRRASYRAPPVVNPSDAESESATTRAARRNSKYQESSLDVEGIADVENPAKAKNPRKRRKKMMVEFEIEATGEEHSHGEADQSGSTSDAASHRKKAVIKGRKRKTTGSSAEVSSSSCHVRASDSESTLQAEAASRYRPVIIRRSTLAVVSTGDDSDLPEVVLGEDHGHQKILAEALTSQGLRRSPGKHSTRKRKDPAEVPAMEADKVEAVIPSASNASPPRKRGRPKKVRPAVLEEPQAAGVVDVSAFSSPRKRGRPKKIQPSLAEATFFESAHNDAIVPYTNVLEPTMDASAFLQHKKTCLPNISRTFKGKAVMSTGNDSESADASPRPRKRGRPKKSQTSSVQKQVALSSDSDTAPDATSSPRKIGRLKKPRPVESEQGFFPEPGRQKVSSTVDLLKDPELRDDKNVGNENDRRIVREKTSGTVNKKSVGVQRKRILSEAVIVSSDDE
ncbi:hypothetical protein BC829DRAFT_392685, partial [Chytridium lagenaria]